MGTLEIQKPAPPANIGNIFSVIDGGDVDASFDGLAGSTLNQWSLVIYTDPQWVLVAASVTSPWIRTVNGSIQPVVQTDDLNLVDGNYLSNGLPIL
jgi:hypothetical protein